MCLLIPSYQNPMKLENTGNLSSSLQSGASCLQLKFSILRTPLRSQEYDISNLHQMNLYILVDNGLSFKFILCKCICATVRTLLSKYLYDLKLQVYAWGDNARMMCVMDKKCTCIYGWVNTFFRSIFGGLTPKFGNTLSIHFQ